MKGLLVVLGEVAGQKAVARLQDGRLMDVIFDPSASERPAPGAIYRARTLRAMKGQGGITVDLGEGQRGYLRGAKGIKEGETLLVQVGTYAEAGKASPVSTKLVFKGRYAIVTPDAPGVNVARSIRDEDVADALRETAHDVLGGGRNQMGVILRSAAALGRADDLQDELRMLVDLAAAVTADVTGPPELLLDAPSAADFAWAEWTDPMPDEVIEEAGAFDHLGILDQLETASGARFDLPGGAFILVEPTTALIAVDVNTGSDMSLAAGLKANINTAKELPRALRLKGLGGQIVVDFAPYPKKDRRLIEQALRAAFRADPVDTTLVGWTPLGHFELQRKRERLPLSEVWT
ncbi:MAG: ribonuclease E/G [Pseudomonadota bacterium]